MIGISTRWAARRKITAAILMASVAGYWLPASSTVLAAAQSSAAIRGVILASDGLTAVQGATVKAANLETSRVYESARTGRDGSYELASLPAGPYELAVETTGGKLYATDTTINAGAGKQTAVSLALRADAQEGTPAGQEKPKEEPPKEQPKPADPNEPSPDANKKKSGTSFWRSKTGASILIVGGAVVLGVGASALSSNNDDDNNDNSMSGGGTGTTPH